MPGALSPCPRAAGFSTRHGRSGPAPRALPSVPRALVGPAPTRAISPSLNQVSRGIPGGAGGGGVSEEEVLGVGCGPVVSDGALCAAGLQSWVWRPHGAWGGAQEDRLRCHRHAVSRADGPLTGDTASLQNRECL